MNNNLKPKPIRRDLIAGNDSFTDAGSGSTDRPVARGFGHSINDAKRKIIQKKRPELVESDRTVESFAIGGNDSAEDPESNSVGETAPAATDDKIVLTQQELNVLIARDSTAMAQSMQSDLLEQVNVMRSDYAKQSDEFNKQIQKITGEAFEATKEVERLNKVFKATGNSTPVGDGRASSAASSRYGLNINRLLLPSSSEPQGAAKDFCDMYSNLEYSPRRQVLDTEGVQYNQRDTRSTDALILKNKDQLIADFELVAKANGLLSGSDNYSGRDRSGFTNASQGSFPEAFLAFVSDVTRLTHTNRHIWWQFPIEGFELGRVPGVTMLVARHMNLVEPTEIEDFILDTEFTMNPVSSEVQSLVTSSVAIKLRGLGLGRGNKVENRPIGVPEFIQATSMLNVLNAVFDRLGIHYNASMDLWIRRMFQKAVNNPANIFYNEAGTLNQTPANINTGEEGTCTQEIMNAISSEMSRRGIPTYPNGLRVAALNSYAVNQLKNDLDNKIAVVTPQQLQDITQILNAGSLGDGLQRLSGYLGDYNGFMVFESLTTGIGTPGVFGSDSVQNTTFGVGSRVTRDSYFFGPGAVGRAVSSPMEIRTETGDFNLFQKFIWRSIEGIDSMDCCSLDALGQPTQEQDRVIILRTVDQAI